MVQHAVLHAQFAGRPTGIPVMRKCVEYAKQQLERETAAKTKAA